MTLDDLLRFIGEEDARLRRRFQGKLSNEREWVLAHVVKLQEEIGELCEQILIAQSLQRDDKKASKKELAAEVADVIITTLLVAKDLGVDVKQALMEKSKVIEGRYKKSG